jgi:hypothetical protein
VIRFKSLGYLISTLSVLLLGGVAWQSAQKSGGLVLACLVLGMATSIVGMAMRWLSSVHEQREKEEKARGAPAKQRQSVSA